MEGEEEDFEQTKKEVMEEDQSERIQLAKDGQIKLILLGDCMVGKTQLIQRLIDD